MYKKARLIIKTDPSPIRYVLPVEVIADNLVRKLKKEQYPILLSMTVGEIGVEVDAYLKRELNSFIEGNQPVLTRIYKDVYTIVHQQLDPQA